MTVSTGNPHSRKVATEIALAAAQQILNNVQALLRKIPPKCQWYAVCWDLDECAFDVSTIRQEPERGDDPALFKQPLVFPWVYIPADPDIADLGGTRSGYAAVVAAVKWLNQHCHGRASLALHIHGQQNTDELADIARSVGGKLLRSVSSGFIPNTTPPIRHREQITARVRSQPLRYTRSRRRSDQLADIVSSGNRHRVRNGLRAAIQQSRTIQRPIPQAVPFVPGHRLRGETEDQFRERVELETYADSIVKAIGLHD